MATPNADKMRNLVKQGKAMPNPQGDAPGRFPIQNGSDLQKAVRAVGRVKPPTEAARAKVRRHIIKRAKALKLTHHLPDTWDASGNQKSGS